MIFEKVSRYTAVGLGRAQGSSHFGKFLREEHHLWARMYMYTRLTYTPMDPMASIFFKLKFYEENTRYGTAVGCIHGLGA